MKTENRLFAIIMVSMFFFAAGYGYWTWYNHNPAYGRPGEVEWVGTIALLFSGLLTGMIWLVFWVIARRIDLRPEDRPDGEISDVSGEVGFFSPGSYWPLGLAFTTVFAGLGVVFWLPWLMVVGAVALLFAVGGLTFEYYTGTRKLGPQ
ncbi:cytochrome c oxidase subunit 4 [Glycomyces sp. TRM65418]|uniref:cytochrome c oxidase subunit 4 n=1 Tax=Glycomyces sp. TRM65418 TaxID=2867006 RepID=UPI001CE5A47B|nr:cytochrome c oxidase subunit 4 [Glycomyces sp. TRM65418]MCC3765213.1 cytochrome c oxidase subunit 4 [Glycomyces sp. TRM65418]QZD54838.1 cytochrome c oxidase subunit 4 [Glycomyces sp. TRM65418]